MVSISEAVQALVDGDLSLQDALQRGYGNYSAIARMLKPRIEEILGRDVKLESVITSVKRARIEHGPRREEIAKIIAGSVINLRTDVAKITVEKTTRTSEILRKTLTDFVGEFLQVLEGMSTVTLVFDQRLFEGIHSTLRGHHILDERKNLAAIIINSPREIVDAAGCTIAFYNPVSRKHINIEESMSCYTDTVIVISMEDTGTAFTTLNDLIAEARRTIRDKSMSRERSIRGYRRLVADSTRY